MTQFVALLRAINSGQNPSQKMENLRKIFENLKFKNVKTIIASGNVLFETKNQDRKALEKRIEDALLKATGVQTPTILYTKEEIQQLVAANPFKKSKLFPTIKPHVTFLKEKTSKIFSQNGKGYAIQGILDRAICYTIDSSSAKTPDIMRLLEKEVGKKITTRTWNTVIKIATA